jgi:tRNA nucleotidyltransferase (CCA-adding enzyme)
VSNYGFLEEPSRLLRATRLVARLGWELDERTQTRFQNAKEENAIEALSPYHRGYELEEIGHEEDGLRVLAALEAQGWMQHLFPPWSTASADAPGLEEMRKLVTQLQMQGVSPDISAASMHYLTAKLAPKDLSALKAMFVRPGFIEEWDNLDNAAKEFNKQLSGKEAATPSATWKLFTSADPQAVLWLGLTSTSSAVQAKYKNFFTVWPEARQKIPHALLQELRITPEVPGYEEMISGLFLGVIDGKLETDEQLRAFLEPYSPPAPPPPVTVRRTRGSKKGAEAKTKIPVEEAEFDGEPLELDDEDAIQEVEVEGEVDVEGEVEDEESEPEDSFPAPAKKSAPAPKKSLPVSEPGNGSGKAQASHKSETSAASPAAAKAAPNPTLHVVAPVKTAKVHVMTKAAKATVPAPSHAHSPAPPAKKALPIKAAPVKTLPAKAAAAAKPVPAKATGRAPAKPAPAAKAAAKSGSPAKKPAPAKLPAKAHKKPEPAKKTAPAKKSAPARKHR